MLRPNETTPSVSGGIMIFLLACIVVQAAVGATTMRENKAVLRTNIPGRVLQEADEATPDHWFAPTPSIRVPSQPCDLRVGVMCRSSDGRLCEAVRSAPGQVCSDQGRLDRLTFQYKPSKCTSSSHQQGSGTSYCEDSNAFPSVEDDDGGEVIINCRSYEDKNELRVNPSRLQPGDFFSIRSDSSRPALPDKVDCIVRSKDDDVYQRNIFDASRDVHLQLKDMFGALTLMACDRMTCMDTFFFEVNLANTGSTIATLTSVEFDLNEDTFDLLDDLRSDSLSPGRMISIEGTADVDVCGDTQFEASATTKGLSPDGRTTCSFVDSMSFMVEMEQTKTPTLEPTRIPTSVPTIQPTSLPSGSPTPNPTHPPSFSPTFSPSDHHSNSPSAGPSIRPTPTPTVYPTRQHSPTSGPTNVSPITEAPTIMIQANFANGEDQQRDPSANPPDGTDRPVTESTNTNVFPDQFEEQGNPANTPTSFPTFKLDLVANEPREPSEEGNLVESPTSFPTFKLDLVANEQQECAVGVVMGCSTQEGDSCDSIELPRGSCFENLTYLTFRYIGRDCNPLGNKQGAGYCEDYGDINEVAKVDILCVDNNGNLLNVNPQVNVTVGDTIQVSQVGRSLFPDMIDCGIFDKNEELLQTNLIDSSGFAILNLKDTFGALDLVACSDEHTCVKDLSFDIELVNAGSKTINIEKLTFVMDDFRKGLLGTLQQQRLTQRSSASLTLDRVVDICEASTFRAQALVEAYPPPSGSFCQGEGTFDFQPPIHCEVGAYIGCLTRDGMSCDTLERVDDLTCSCPNSGCPNSLRFRYKAASCADTTFAENCQDLADTLPMQARIRVSAKDTIISNQIVDFGSEVTIANDGACLPETLTIAILDVDGSSELQMLEISPRCSADGIDLLSTFGSLEFSGYTCQSGLERNCYAEGVTWTFYASNRGVTPVRLAQLTVDADGHNLDLMDNMDPRAIVLTPGENSFVSHEISNSVPLCESSLGEVLFVVQADGPSGAQCTERYLLQFDPPPIKAAGSSQPGRSTPSPVPFDAATVPPSQLMDGSSNNNNNMNVEDAMPTSPPPVATSTNDMRFDDDCFMSASMRCELPNGLDCSMVQQPPSSVCSGNGPISSIVFAYRFAECQDSANQQGDEWKCQDVTLTTSESVVVKCYDTSSVELQVSPRTVALGERFQVTTFEGGPLPDKLDCRLVDSNNIPIQRNLIDVSGESELSLRDSFGSLIVDACGESVCNLSYNFYLDVRNIGEVPFFITMADFGFNGVEGSLLSAVEDELVVPGDSSGIVLPIEVNVCHEQDFTVEMKVVGVPPHGRFCSGEDDITIHLPAVPWN